MALEAAAGFSLSLTHYEVFPDHLILKLLEEGSGDIPLILKHFDIEPDTVWTVLHKKLERFQTGNSGGPRFAPALLELVEAGWIVTSIHLDSSVIRSGALIEPYLENGSFAMTPLGDLLGAIEGKTLRREFYNIVAESTENTIAPIGEPAKAGKATAVPGDSEALEKYTIDVTGNARNGEIDPVYGRDMEIRQVVDILSRRRKNNPILVGEAGVGKTAIVEGLAVRIVEGDVIDSLKDTEIRGLDLGLLQAGAGVKGEFESRLKAVINGIMNSPKRMILFIDEAHTLIGAGGAAGSGDAANLLKPALARGKLRTIGATTWSEYKKYIEKDPALERRFQVIKVDEPDVKTGVIMLRGVRELFEKHHGLTITDSAVNAAVELSQRYISGRQLPDKAVDVLDTAAARVKMSLSGSPKQLEFLQRQKEYDERKLASLKRDLSQGHPVDADDIEEVKREIEKAGAGIEELEAKWEVQKKLVDQITIEKNKSKEIQESESGEVDADRPINQELEDMRKELNELHRGEPLVMADVNETVVASVIADWTGIPLGSMVKGQAEALLAFEETVGANIIGQDAALAEMANCIRVTKSGIGKQNNPIGVFLFVGPSGVGKSQTARYTAEVLFGGERFMTTINMSEYQEKHTVSQLKGSPPGYVGYGEGGVLTEAVRRRPYSVILLDEVEKADREVMNLFYQVFDQGNMRDGEGREIDFKNTVIIMASNIGSEQLISACENQEITSAEANEILRPLLSHYFQAAFLARVRVIPFLPLNTEAIRKITSLKMGALKERLQQSHKITVDYGEDVLSHIAARSTQVESGARNVDYVIERHLLPDISRSLVEVLATGAKPKRLNIYNENGEIAFTLE